MKYFEYSFSASDETTAEILLALLAEKGFDTFEHNDNQLSAYIPLSDLQQKFTFSWSVRKYEDKNWNEEWEKNFKPVVVADKVLIRAPFHKQDPDIDFEIVIEPRMSFGTGHHESTYLMVEEICGLDLKNKSVCDAGCGTGILAILAAIKGASQVLAIDNNEWAYQNAIDNAVRNDVFETVKVALGELEMMDGNQFDVVLANINKPIILQCIPLFFRSLNPGGLLLLSGILQNDLPDILNEAQNYFFTALSTRSKNEWVCATLAMN
jgi:ribosomal protein L11 methyltransferase